jgi:hypothetical protein
LFRSKTLILQDPIFMDDNLAVLQGALSQWGEAGEELVASAALDVKVSQLRLLHHTITFLAQRSVPAPHSLLRALDALLDVDRHLAVSTAAQHLTATRQLVQSLALNVGTVYSQANRDGVPQLVVLLAAHSEACDWSAGLLQLEPTDLVTVLPALPVSQPAALQCVLRQCDLSGLSGRDAAACLAALLAGAPPHVGTPAGGELARTLCAVFIQLGIAHVELNEAAGEAVLRLLLSAAKGGAPSSCAAAITGTPVDQPLVSVDVAAFAGWVFGPSTDGADGRVAVDLLSSLDWGWVGGLSPGLRLRWLLGLVAVAKRLEAGRDGEAIAVLHAVIDGALGSDNGWAVCQPGDGNADEAYLLCMIEVTRP